MALSLNAPNAFQTALALRHAIWREERPDWPVCGIPECLCVDNGSDFTSRRHGGAGQTPLTRWQANGFLPNMPESLEALDMLLLQVARPRKVLRDGIRFQGRRYVEPTLAAFAGEQVEVLHDPRDPAEGRIYHQGSFICRGLSFEHAAAPVLDDIDRARRAALSSRRDVSGNPCVPASSPAPPRRQHGLKLYADDD